MKLALALFGSMFALETFACSAMPLSMRTDFFNDAASRVLSADHLRISEIKVGTVKFTNETVVKYEWVKTDPAFMCHDRETLKTDVEIPYVKNTAGSVACVITGTVTKLEAFYTDAPKTVYTVENVRNECD